MRKREAPGHSGTDRDRTMIKKKWSSLSFSEKIRYIRDYYGVAILLALIGVIAAVYLIHDIRTPKAKDAFYVMGLDLDVDAGMVESMEAELHDLLGLTSDLEEVRIETDYSSDANYMSQATISTFMQAGRVDLMIASEEEFNAYAAAQYCLTLEEAGLKDYQDQTDLDHLFYAVPLDYSQGGAIYDIPFAPHEDSEGAFCYGIYLQQGPLEGYVLGVLANAPHTGYLSQGVAYFLDGQTR